MRSLPVAEISTYIEALPGVLGNRGNREFISGEQGNKGQILRGTKTILGNREHKKTNFRFLRNRGTSQFISGEQGNRYPLGRPQYRMCWINCACICVYCSTSRENCCCGVWQGRIKSGNFGHQVNSDILLQTVEIQMRRLLMSRLIRIFTVCLVHLFFHSNN